MPGCVVQLSRYVKRLILSALSYRVCRSEVVLGHRDLIEYLACAQLSSYGPNGPKRSFVGLSSKLVLLFFNGLLGSVLEFRRQTMPKVATFQGRRN
jgi:hypothetical protein